MELLTFEKALYNKGIKFIAGVDEVGRGPLAGPMVVAAVVLNLEKLFDLEKIYGKYTDGCVSRNNDVLSQKFSGWETWENYAKINDSKKVGPRTRYSLSRFIRAHALSFSIVKISNVELDRIGIAQATQKCFYNAVKSLKVAPEHVFTDTFEIRKLAKNSQTNITKGDGNSISIAAASIIAKVYRDGLMSRLHKKYPVYGFDQHKGYGTRLHIENLCKYGPCEIHRQSFSPVRELLLAGG